jgi:hypothetical protein
MLTTLGESRVAIVVMSGSAMGAAVATVAAGDGALCAKPGVGRLAVAHSQAKPMIRRIVGW